MKNLYCLDFLWKMKLKNNHCKCCLTVFNWLFTHQWHHFSTSCLSSWEFPYVECYMSFGKGSKNSSYLLLQPGDWQKGTCLWWRGSNNFFSSSILVPWEQPIAAKGIRFLHSVWIDQESNKINIDFTYVISLQNYLQMNGCIYAIGQSQTISWELSCWLLNK